MRWRRFTISRMMLTVAILAVIMTTCMWIGRWIDDAIPTTDPVKWATRRARYHETQPTGTDGFGRDDTAYHQEQAKRYRKLAEGFRRIKATSQEATYNGPFTDKLTTGQAVIVQLEVSTGSLGILAAGTKGDVLSDPAGDEDDCSDGRKIDVRILDGPHAGKSVAIERISLCRE